MPVMDRPNSKAKKLHAQALLNAQMGESASGLLAADNTSTQEDPDLIKENEFKRAPESKSFAGMQQR